jgi:hypothetical protein
MAARRSSVHDADRLVPGSTRGVHMSKYTLTFRTESGWALLWGLIRIGVVVLVAFNAPWWITVLFVLSQLRFSGDAR